MSPAGLQGTVMNDLETAGRARCPCHCLLASSEDVNTSPEEANFSVAAQWFVELNDLHRLHGQHCFTEAVAQSGRALVPDATNHASGSSDLPRINWVHIHRHLHSVGQRQFVFDSLP